jgi:hypothetical protein
MNTDWAVDGYIVTTPLLITDTVELWRARDRATGRSVALRRLRTTAYAATEVRRLIARLVEVPHAARMDGVVETTDGCAVVHEFPAGGTLTGLMEVRERLLAGEIVTLGVPLAESLSAAHAIGLAHGAVNAAVVVFDNAGRPGLMWPGAPHGSADGDIHDLSALLSSLLPPDAPETLVAALQAREGAAALARDLMVACEPVPMRLRRPRNRSAAAPRSSAVATKRADRADRSRRFRLASVIGAALLALTVAVGLGISWAHTGGGATSTIGPVVRPTAAPTASAVDWRKVVHDLDARRDRAFLAGDLAALRQVYVPGSKALTIDETALRTLLSRRLRAHGLRLVLVSVTVVETRAVRTSLHVVDRLPAYELVDATGRPAVRRPARGLRSWRLDLDRVGSGWRIASVRAA